MKYSENENVTEKYNCGESDGPCSPPNEGQSKTASQVERIQKLIGRQAVLIPVPKGEKGPKRTDWQKATVELMKDPAYLAELEAGNIGVLLGKLSAGLCAIDLDDDAFVEPFLELNPKLRQTLRSRGARGAQIWVKIVGEYPKLTKLKDRAGEAWGEWRADGGQSVIHGVHPSG